MLNFLVLTAFLMLVNFPLAALTIAEVIFWTVYFMPPALTLY